MNYHNYILVFLCLVCFQLTGQSFYKISSPQLNGHFNSLTSDVEGNLYALNTFQYFKIEPNGIIQVTDLDCGNLCDFLDIAVSPDGAVYLASDKGLYVKTTNGNLDLLHTDYLKDVAIAQDGTVFFLGSQIADHQFGYYKDGNTVLFNTANSIFTSESVYDIEVDSKGSAYIACEDGIIKWSNGNFELIYPEQIFDLQIDGNDRLYACRGSDEVIVQEPNSTNFETFGFFEVRGNFIGGHADGTIFTIKAFTDVYYFDGDSWRELEEEIESIPSQIPRAAHRMSTGEFVVSLDFQDDIFVFLPEETSSTSQANNAIEVCPNPAKDHVAVSSTEVIKEVSLTDVTGKKVYTATINANRTSINTSSYQSGTYILHLNTGTNTTMEKVVIQN